MLPAEGEREIKLYKNLDDLPDIPADQGRLNQVFTNLIHNAFEAIKAKEAPKEEFIFITTKKEKEHILVRIKDTGVGMSPETQARLFDKYYTTKDSQHKRGLGMCLIKKIIESHQGNISFETEEGKGTVFTLRFPMTNSVQS